MPAPLSQQLDALKESLSAAPEVGPGALRVLITILDYLAEKAREEESARHAQTKERPFPEFGNADDKNGRIQGVEREILP